MASTLALTDAEEDPSPDHVRPKIPLSLPREVLLLLSPSDSLVVSSRKVSPVSRLPVPVPRTVSELPHFTDRALYPGGNG